jgi:hypothetical protein
MRQSLTALTLLLSVAACAPFPAVDAAASDPRVFPDLQPIDSLLAQAGDPSPDPAPDLMARASALRTRVAQVSAPRL